jgi:hypothetical protein
MPAATKAAKLLLYFIFLRPGVGEVKGKYLCGVVWKIEFLPDHQDLYTSRFKARLFARLHYARQR